MKAYIALCAFMCSFLLSAQSANLIRNPDFERKLDDECRHETDPGVMKKTIFTEDRTWNRCLKIEAVKYREDKKLGKVFYSVIRLGGDGKTPGFAVKPNTIYSYSIELKGNLPCRLVVYGWKGSNYWKDLKSLKVNGESVFKPSQDWTVKKVTFQTGADTKFAAVGISVWGAERYKSLPELGSFVLLDNVKVTEQTDLLATAAEKSDGSDAVVKKKP